MHQWDDVGIVIAVSRYGEQSAIIRLLTEQHGLCAGMAKGVFSKKSRGVYQAGNILHVHWQARLEEHLGSMRCELLRSCTGQLLSDERALQLVNAATTMVQSCVPERIEEKEIFILLSALIDKINASDDENAALLTYVKLEFSLLQNLGFGLDLTECAALGDCPREELVYVSPKSGRAVSRSAGEPYKARLLPLPVFLRDEAGAEESAPDMRQMLDGLALTGYFLESWILQPEGKKLPEARQRLLRYLEAQNNK